MKETVHDWIALDDGEVHVWCVALNTVDVDAHEHLLDSTELEQTDKFRFPKDARRYRAARHLLRTVLSLYLGCGPWDIAYELGEYGKPELKYPADSSLKFNVSHSGDLVVVAVARKEVGVDVEWMRPVVPVREIAQSFFLPAEQAYLSALPENEIPKAFYQLWTRKEALLKATGEGLNGLSPDVDTLTDCVFMRLGRIWYVRDFLPGEGYAGALAVERESVDMNYMGWDECWLGLKKI